MAQLFQSLVANLQDEQPKISWELNADKPRDARVAAAVHEVVHKNYTFVSNDQLFGDVNAYLKLVDGIQVPAEYLEELIKKTAILSSVKKLLQLNHANGGAKAAANTSEPTHAVVADKSQTLATFTSAPKQSLANEAVQKPSKTTSVQLPTLPDTLLGNCQRSLVFSLAAMQESPVYCKLVLFIQIAVADALIVNVYCKSVTITMHTDIAPFKLWTLARDAFNALGGDQYSASILNTKTASGADTTLFLLGWK